MYVHHDLRTLQIDRLSLAFIDEGSGSSTILFLHGMGSDHYTWDRNISHLKTEHRCIAVDLPGYGNSHTKNVEFTLGYYAEIIPELLYRLETGPVVLAGHSMGAQLAIKLALEDPALFSRLILIAPAGFERFSAAEGLFLKNLYHPDFLKHLSLNEYLHNLKSNFYLRENRDQEMIDHFIKIFGSPKFQVYCQTLSDNLKSMLQNPVRDQLVNIIQPVLIFFGHQDMLIPNRVLHPNLSTIEIAQSGRRQIGKSRLEMIDNAGHFVHWEQASLVNRCIDMFIN